MLVIAAVLQSCLALSVTNVGNDLPTCNEPSCLSTGESLLNSLDLDVDPCHDFDAFVCGRWRQKNLIPEDANAISSVSITMVS